MESIQASHPKLAEGYPTARSAYRLARQKDVPTPIMGEVDGPVMTDSGKWAWYAPANLGFDVVFGSMDECVRSASLGRVWRDPGVWEASADA